VKRDFAFRLEIGRPISSFLFEQNFVVRLGIGLRVQTSDAVGKKNGLAFMPGLNK